MDLGVTAAAGLGATCPLPPENEKARATHLPGLLISPLNLRKERTSWEWVRARIVYGATWEWVTYDG